MPKGTLAHHLYEKFLKQGHSKKKAAKMAQSASGQSLKTGKPPKGKK